MVALISTVANINLAFGAQNSDPPAYVYLTWARDDTAHSINVSWRTDENYIGQVRYDTKSRAGDPNAYYKRVEGAGGVTTDKFDGYIHHVELTGLDPDTIYYFICGHPDHGWSEEGAFQTGPANGTSFRFVVGGDSRWDARGHPDWPRSRDNISRLMAQYNPSFVIFTGDFLWNGERQEGPDTWDNWFKAMHEHWVTPQGLMIPIIPVIGNHEMVYPQPTDYDPKSHATNYYELFNLPGNERWCALSWGPDLRIIVLDSEVLDPGKLTWHEQVDWLGEELTVSKDYLWKVVTFHRDMISARSQIQYMIDDWASLFDLYHVDLVMMGHFHVYERSHPLNWTSAPGENVAPENGIVYVVSGGWGAPLYSSGPKWFTARGPISKYNFVVVDVFENGTLHLRAIDMNGEVIDEFSISKEVPAPEAGLSIAAIVVSIVVVVCAGVAFYLLRMRGKS